MTVKFTRLNLQGSIDWKLDSINRISCRLFFFLQNFQLNPSLYDVQGFMFCFKYKKKNPSHVLEVVDMLCVWIFCEIYRCLPSYTVRVIKIKIDVKNLVNLWLLWIKERSNLWTSSCHMIIVVSFLLEVAIEC